MVHPQEGLACSINKSSLPILVTMNVAVAGTPCFILPKSYVSTLNFAISSDFFCANNAEEHKTRAANSKFFMLIFFVFYYSFFKEVTEVFNGAEVTGVSHTSPLIIICLVLLPM